MRKFKRANRSEAPTQVETTQSYTYKFESLRWVWPDGHTSYDPPPLVVDQIRAYGRHYNSRIEISRWSRGEYREARKVNVPEFTDAETVYKACQAEIEKIRMEMKVLKQETRRREVGAEIRERLTVAVQARKTAGATLKAAKLATTENPSLILASRAIRAEQTNREKKIRSETPAYWGTYLMAEYASQVSARKAKVDPAFRRWNQGLPTSSEIPCPEGKIGIQVQRTKPLTVAGLYGCHDSRIQLAPAPAKTRSRADWVRGRIRIGSDGRDPIWAEFEVKHRHAARMSLDSRITWAWINRRRHGTHWRHALCIGVERQPPAQHPALNRTLALDINMRIVDSGIRIGYSYDGDVFREYILPRTIIDQLERTSELRSTRDKEFDVFRDELVQWLSDLQRRFEGTSSLSLLGTGGLGQREVPPWLTEKTKFLSTWRSSARLAGVVLHWRGNRFAGDEAMYARAEQWRSQDRHLADYYFGYRQQAQNRRQELYRQWSNEIFKIYGVVVVAAWDWSEMARLPKPEKESDLPDAVRTMRFAVAPSDLVAAVAHTARHRGGRLIKAELGKLAEIGCLACQSKTINDDKEGGWVTCMNCGRRILRDEMQARLLYANRERFGDEHVQGVARDSEAGDITASF